MTALLGTVGVWVALAGALGASVMLILTLGIRQDERHNRAFPWVAVMVSGCVVAVVAMEIALLTDNFSLAYVAANSTKTTPVLYKFATLWGALEGSLLLWALVLCLYVSAVSLNFRHQISDRLVAWALLTMLVVCVFFFGLLAGPADPFGTLPNPPVDGNGLNPLLRNHPLMAIHPVMLYFGYVGFTVPFSFAIAALVTGRLDERWLTSTRVWTLIAWGSLTVGVLLGADS